MKAALKQCRRESVSRAESHKQAKSRTEGSGSELSDMFPCHEHNTTASWLVESASHWDEEVKEQRKTRTFTQPAAPSGGAQTSSSLLGSLESRCSSARHQPATQRNAQRE